MIPRFYYFNRRQTILFAFIALILIYSTNSLNAQNYRGQTVAFTTSEPILPGSRYFEDKLSSAIDAFYRADWSATRSVLQELRASGNPDLRVDFFEAMIPFWAYFFGGNDPADAQRFLDLSDAAVQTGDRILAVSPGDTATVLMMGGLHGYRSLVAASERRYRTAISSGVSGHSFTRILLSLDNDDPNTLMGQGVFEYMIGSIPREARWIARLAGLTGSVERGYEILEQASGSESFVSNDAAMFLAWFYESDGRYEDAVRHLTALNQRYPENVIFLYNLARLLETTGRPAMAAPLYGKVVSLGNTSLPVLRHLATERLQQLNLN